MTDAPTVKAILSTVLTFAFIVGVGAFTNAIGQKTAHSATVPAANPYETVDSETAVAAHNQPDQAAPSTGAAHNVP